MPGKAIEEVSKGLFETGLPEEKRVLEAKKSFQGFGETKSKIQCQTKKRKFWGVLRTVREKFDFTIRPQQNLNIEKKSQGLNFSGSG